MLSHLHDEYKYPPNHLKMISNVYFVSAIARRWALLPRRSQYFMASDQALWRIGERLSSHVACKLSDVQNLLYVCSMYILSVDVMTIEYPVQCYA